ncbi:hypothetical protein JG688_00013198 [Phytophthora aleatoria]|uniref:Crinkler effector protein N-terminal domain-containing protein n=1 Tax=Phytophthora aleatoria TaxID=2496075 RepID=A0A8J5IE04_9STRA|nr:hypothetical protein JG688_00013198 [Phytophthora aleatoria]
MLTVTCVLLGFNIPPFAVDFEGDDTIGDLKALIKTQQQNTLKCDSSDLELHLAAKDGYWLADDDYLVVKLVNGDINDETHELISATPVDSKTLVLNWWEDKNMPQPSSGQIHVFVKVPVRYHPQPWSISVSVYDSMDTAIARMLYRFASPLGYIGYYDPELRTADKDVILWYEGTTLNARVLFKTERIALLIGSDLHEEVATEMSPLEGLTIQTKVTEVPGEPTELHPVSQFDYAAQTIEFPDGAVSSVVNQTTDEFKYQRIEDDGVFHHLELACNWCLVTRGSFQQWPYYRRFIWDRSCRLALSREMSGWYYGLSCHVPVMNIRVESISEHPVVEDRFEIKLVIRAIDVQCGKFILGRLKKGVEVSADGLEMRTSVYVQDPISFCACMDWRYVQIEENWKAVLVGSTCSSG